MDRNYEEVVQERPQLQYESQIKEIHSIIDSLENKVQHISLHGGAKSGTETTEIKPDLNLALDEVIRRLYRVVSDIHN